jgi:hypothetical protein
MCTGGHGTQRLPPRFTLRAHASVVNRTLYAYEHDVIVSSGVENRVIVSSGQLCRVQYLRVQLWSPLKLLGPDSSSTPCNETE